MVGSSGMHDADCAKASDHTKACNCALSPNYTNSTQMKTEAVNHPSHYGGAGNVYETILVIEAWGLDFNLGNCVKYVSRAGKKDPAKTVEDLKKARFYLDRAIQNLEKTK